MRFVIAPNRRRGMFLALLTSICTLILYLHQTPNSFAQPLYPPTPSSTPIETAHKNIYLLIYNPIMENLGNERMFDAMGWNDPQVLTTNVIADLNQDSNGYVNYTITHVNTLDQYPAFVDGFVYNDVTWLECWNNPTTCHTGWSDYNAIIVDNQLCDLRNSGEIDEVWIWSAHYLGFYESRLAGPGGFWYNSPPVENTTCQHLLPIMGLNPERTEAEALHSYGHRSESALAEAYGGWKQDENGRKNNWYEYTLYGGNAPPNLTAGCGNIHFPPNGIQDYDYWNTDQVVSSCIDWLNYPNLTGQTESVDCNNWDCSHRGYMNWWYSHLPNSSGVTSGRLNNWWKYIVDYEAAKTEENEYSHILPIVVGANDVDVSCTFTPSKNEVYLGLNTACNPDELFTAGFRFENIVVPAGKEIEAAYLIAKAADTTDDNHMDLTISFEPGASPAPFSNAHPPSSANTITQTITWPITQSWTWTSIISTPDISPLINTVIDTYGLPIPAINIVVYNSPSSNPTDYRRLYAYERDPLSSAKLILIYKDNPSPDNDADGDVDFIDFSRQITFIINSQSQGDLNQDAQTNILDIPTMFRQFGPQ